LRVEDEVEGEVKVEVEVESLVLKTNSFSNFE
jgi:hypothetical protein